MVVIRHSDVFRGGLGVTPLTSEGGDRPAGAIPYVV